MGISRGCAVFSFDGQCGTIPVPAGYKIAEKGLPKNAPKAVHWTTLGELTPNFQRFQLPFIRGVIRHQLVPTRQQVLDNVRLAVYNDQPVGDSNATKGTPPGTDPYYYEWKPLYEGTYGFRDYKEIPGTLMEFFPNTGRYHYFPVLPQGNVDLGKGIQSLPLSELSDPSVVKARFDDAYPEWYQGDALVNLVADTLTVLNSHENLDLTESYSVPLPHRGNFLEISGTIRPHAYVMGKFEDGNQRLWLQANTEYFERGDTTELTLLCKHQPQVQVTPEMAAKVNHWDAATGKLTLHLSHDDGPVEVEVQHKSEMKSTTKERE
jgi:hypothetical protein